MRGLLHLYGVPAPHSPSPAANGWHPAPDPVVTAWILAIFTAPVMYVLFCLMCGELYDWWQQRGWRAKHRRRSLK